MTAMRPSENLSEEMFQHLFEILNPLMEVAEQDPDLQQDISFLLNISIQVNQDVDLVGREKAFIKDEMNETQTHDEK